MFLPLASSLSPLVPVQFQLNVVTKCCVLQPLGRLLPADPLMRERADIFSSMDRMFSTRLPAPLVPGSAATFESAL
jgi:hypothetical protein